MLKTLALVLVAAAALFTQLPAQAHPSVDIVASNWKFTPKTITVAVGEETTLRITSTEGVHGIASTELGIPQTMIMPGKFVTVKFTPKKAGTYVLHCAIMCGAGHGDMILTVIVK